MSTIIRPSDVFKSEEYEKGFADGSLSVTEQIINEKVVKYLAEEKEKIVNSAKNGYMCFAYFNKLHWYDSLINHFMNEK